MKSVIVIGSNYASSLGLIRSLGEAGYEVRVLALRTSVYQIAAKSKYVTKALYVSIKNDFFEEHSFEAELGALERLRGNDDKILIIPCRDITCKMLESHWDQLSAHFYFPNINEKPGEIEQFSDKFIQEALAQDCGIPTACGKAYYTDEKGINEAVASTEFPCFMKPLSSFICKDEKKYLIECKNSDDLRSWMHKAAEDGGCAQVLLERVLPVDRELSAYGVAYKGRVSIPACILTIRNGLGTHKGIAAEGEAVSSVILGDLKPKLEEFVRRSGLNGLFCIDLLESKGKLFFLEMNLRMGGSCYAVTKAGANLPATLAGCIYHQCGEWPETIEKTVHFLSELIDVDNYMHDLISFKELKANLTKNTLRFIKNTDDPKPWRQMKKKAIIWMAKKIAREIAGKQ